MKILAIAKVYPQTTLEKMKPHIEAEVRHAWKMYREGAVREMYDRPGGQGVVFVLEQSSVDEARRSLDELPFVRERLIDFDVMPLNPFSYFETLFREEKSPQQG